MKRKDERIYKERRNPLLERDILSILLEKTNLCPTDFKKEVAKIRHGFSMPTRKRIPLISLSTISQSLHFLKEQQLVSSMNDVDDARRTKYYLTNTNKIRVLMLMNFMREIRAPKFVGVEEIEDRDLLPALNGRLRKYVKSWIIESRFLLKAFRPRNENVKPLRYTWLTNIDDEGCIMPALRRYIELDDDYCLPHETGIEAVEMILDGEQDLAGFARCTIRKIVEDDPKDLHDLCLLGIFGPYSAVHYFERLGRRRDPIICIDKSVYRMELAERISTKKDLEPPITVKKNSLELTKGFVDNEYDKIVTTTNSKVTLDAMNIPELSGYPDFGIDDKVTVMSPRPLVVRRSLVEEGQFSVRNLLKHRLPIYRLFNNPSWRFKRALDYSRMKWTDTIDAYNKYLNLDD
jgi:DNA-binding PadR family transcriptional regulator